MVATRIKDLSLYDVQSQFALSLSDRSDFFTEWPLCDASVTSEEQLQLDQIKSDYLYLSQKPRNEGTVKLVVISRLLAIAGFYRPPFDITAEKAIKIQARDEGRVFRGFIDILVFQDQFWILVIESKHTQFSLETAIPQALAYMTASPNLDRPVYGMVTNGSEYQFLKLVHQPKLEYQISDLFSLRRGNDLYTVLNILKCLGAVATH